MGFSVSGSFAIIVLASFIAFGMLYSAGSSSFERVSEATGDTYDSELARQNTAIEITRVDYQDDQLEVNVTNRGTTTLAINDTDLIVDNAYRTYDEMETVEVVDHPDTELWLPNETLTFQVTESETPQRVKVVTEHGVADSGVVA